MKHNVSLDTPNNTSGSKENLSICKLKCRKGKEKANAVVKHGTEFEVRRMVSLDMTQISASFSGGSYLRPRTNRNF